MAGIDSLEKVVDAAGEAVNVIHKIANHGSVLNALALTDELSALGSIPKGSVVEQLKDLNDAERVSLMTRFKDKVSIDDKVLEATIEAGVDSLEKVIEYGYRSYEHIKAGVALYAEIASLFKK